MISGYGASFVTNHFFADGRLGKFTEPAALYYVVIHRIESARFISHIYRSIQIYSIIPYLLKKLNTVLHLFIYISFDFRCCIHGFNIILFFRFTPLQIIQSEIFSLILYNYFLYSLANQIFCIRSASFTKNDTSVCILHCKAFVGIFKVNNFTYNICYFFFISRRLYVFWTYQI